MYPEIDSNARPSAMRTGELFTSAPQASNVRPSTRFTIRICAVGPSSPPPAPAPPVPVVPPLPGDPPPLPGPLPPDPPVPSSSLHAKRKAAAAKARNERDLFMGILDVQ